jgi:hypothetical protein
MDGYGPTTFDVLSCKAYTTRKSTSQRGYVLHKRNVTEQPITLPALVASVEQTNDGN